MKCYTYIFGVGGQGKTLLAKEIVRARVANGGRAVILDPNDTFGGYGERVSVEQACAVLRGAGARRFSVRVVPEWSEELTEVFAACFDCGRLLLVVDEAADYGAAGSLDLNYLKLVQKGRNRNLDMVTTQLAPVDLHPKVRNQYDVCISFRQSEPGYADMMEEKFFRRRGVSRILQALPQGRYLRVTKDGEISQGQVRIPGR